MLGYYIQPDLVFVLFFFFFNDTATTEIYTLSLHDALPILPSATTWHTGTRCGMPRAPTVATRQTRSRSISRATCFVMRIGVAPSSRGSTAECQDRVDHGCRLLLGDEVPRIRHGVTLHGGRAPRPPDREHVRGLRRPALAPQHERRDTDLLVAVGAVVLEVHSRARPSAPRADPAADGRASASARAHSSGSCPRTRRRSARCRAARGA